MSVKADGVIRITDYAGQPSSVNPNLQNMDDAGTAFGSIAQDLDEIKDAINPLIIGVIEYAKLSLTYLETGQPAAGVQAARESKWEVTYKDTTRYLDGANAIDNPGYGKLFTLELPTADRTLLDDNEEFLDLTDAVVATAIAGLEPNIRSPYNRVAEVGVTPTNEIIQIKYVGRDL